MKKNWTHIAMGATATMLITASIAVALNISSDDDLRNLLDTVEQVDENITQPEDTGVQQENVTDDSIMNLLGQANAQVKVTTALPAEQDDPLAEASDGSINNLLQSMGGADDVSVQEIMASTESVPEDVDVIATEQPVVLAEMAVEEPLIEAEAVVVEEPSAVEFKPEVIVEEVEPLIEEPVVEFEPEVVVDEPVIEEVIEVVVDDPEMIDEALTEVEAIELAVLETNDLQDAELIEPTVVVEELETTVIEPELADADSDDPLLRVLESMNASEEEADASEVEGMLEEVMELEVAEVESELQPEELVDDVGMATYDDATASKAENLISVRLNKVGLEEAINLFAQLSGANIIVPELSEAAQISVNLKDVEWRPALQSILDTYNYELYQRVSGSNVYSVRRRPEGAPEPQVVETFKLNYATVPNAAELVRQLLPDDAKISEFASRNMLVVKSTESSLSEVRSVLASIDTVRQQVFIEAKFMELTDRVKTDLGVDWRVLESYSAGTVGNPSYTHKSELTKRDMFDDGGASFQDAKKDYIEPVGASPSGGPVVYGLTPTKDQTLSKVFTSVLDVDQFRLFLSALESKNGVNIVSNPKIIVANEETANISIIEREPNLKQTLNEALNDTASSVIFELDPKREFFDFGIMVDVTPSINTSSNITVKIKPSLTRKVAEKLAGEHNSYPVISEKSISTIFNLTSGQTAAIGGLAEVEERDVERRVPLLSRIPFLGRLFSWEEKVNGQSETIIFVTVGLANTQEIDYETGMPVDTELARRRITVEQNRKALFNKNREYFIATEKDRLEDKLEILRKQEELRLKQREEATKRRLEKEEKNAEKEARKNNKIAAAE